MEKFRKEVAELADRRRKVAIELQKVLITKWEEFSHVINENLDVIVPKFLVQIYDGDELYDDEFLIHTREIWAMWDKAEKKITFEEIDSSDYQNTVINSDHDLYIPSYIDIKRTELVRYTDVLIAGLEKYKTRLEQKLAKEEKALKTLTSLEEK